MEWLLDRIEGLKIKLWRFRGVGDSKPSNLGKISTWPQFLEEG